MERYKSAGTENVLLAGAHHQAASTNRCFDPQTAIKNKKRKKIKKNTVTTSKNCSS